MKKFLMIVAALLAVTLYGKVTKHICAQEIAKQTGCIKSSDSHNSEKNQLLSSYHSGVPKWLLRPISAAK